MTTFDRQKHVASLLTNAVRCDGDPEEVYAACKRFIEALAAWGMPNDVAVPGDGSLAGEVLASANRMLREKVRLLQDVADAARAVIAVNDTRNLQRLLHALNALREFEAMRFAGDDGSARPGIGVSARTATCEDGERKGGADKTEVAAGATLPFEMDVAIKMFRHLFPQRAEGLGCALVASVDPATRYIYENLIAARGRALTVTKVGGKR